MRHSKIGINIFKHKENILNKNMLLFFKKYNTIFIDFILFLILYSKIHHLQSPGATRGRGLH